MIPANFCPQSSFLVSSRAIRFNPLEFFTMPTPPPKVAAVEQLEFRYLRAVSFSNGVVTVEGTGGADTVTLSIDPNDANSVLIKLNSDTPQSFSMDDITGGILINVGSGDDRVTVDESNGVVPVQTTVSAGDGHDTITMGAGSARVT